jgi:hypothetical protein
LNFVGFVGQQAAWPTVRAGRPRCPHGRRAERCARLPKSWLAPRRSVAPVQLSGFFAAKTRASPRFFAIALRPDRWAGRASRCRVTYALKRAGGGQGDPPQGRSVGAATQVDCGVARRLLTQSSLARSRAVVATCLSSCSNMIILCTYRRCSSCRRALSSGSEAGFDQ